MAAGRQYTTLRFSGGVGHITGVIKTAQGVFPQHSTRTISKQFARANAIAHRSGSLTIDVKATLGEAGLEALAAKFCELARPLSPDSRRLSFRLPCMLPARSIGLET